jgi:diaminohydroxyphosphoribosylaminopyrimidine deaminase / 5-amino-6-(5-phosphoribosylamino)uracil reductase
VFSAEDHRYMSRALQLAEQGRFTTSPNPNVGCVIVVDGQIVGEGFHLRAGGPHAEVHALRMAGEKAKGATAYVTLEPCSHFGRTPPCADALVNAGVKRVVAAMEDPNPQVSGRGMKRLADAGITVQIGLLQSQAEALNPGFIKRMRTSLPYIRLKMAASLDGRTALANGQSQWITSPAARADVQRWRAQSSAILTGADTVLVDDPLLNVRWEQLPSSLQTTYAKDVVRQPIRIIIDSQQRISPDAKLFSLSSEVWLARQKVQGQWSEQVQQLITPLTNSGKLDLLSLMQTLAQRNMNDIWVEAGATLAGALLNTGLVDELIVYLAPKLMGNPARGLVNLPEFHHMSEVAAWHWQDVRKVGDDLRLILRPHKE